MQERNEHLSQEPNEKLYREVEEALTLFDTVWSQLETGHGEMPIRLPKEVFWLNGAPGSGKGTQAPFIMKDRGFKAPPIVVSDLLEGDDARKCMDAGRLVKDGEVIQAVFSKLLDPVYQEGIIVDGFPRTHVQIQCLKGLYHKVKKGLVASVAGEQPQFHIIVLLVDEQESIARQLFRGKQALAHNQQVALGKAAELIEVRETDLDRSAARTRYLTFKEQTYTFLKLLEGVLPFYTIDAHGTIEAVRRRILERLKGAD